MSADDTHLNHPNTHQAGKHQRRASSLTTGEKTFTETSAGSASKICKSVPCCVYVAPGFAKRFCPAVSFPSLSGDIHFLYQITLCNLQLCWQNVIICIISIYETQKQLNNTIPQGIDTGQSIRVKTGSVL